MASIAPLPFLSILVLVTAMIIWWRVTMIVVGAIVITVLVVGAYEVIDHIDQPSAGEIVTGPAADGSLPVPGQ